MNISQELFDETVLENQEIFELSDEEALSETISQFRQQNIDISNYSGIITSHPFTNLGKKERSYKAKFLSHLNFMDEFIAEDGSIQYAYGDKEKDDDGDIDESEQLILNALQEINKALKSASTETIDENKLDCSETNSKQVDQINISNIYMPTLIRSEGFFTLLSFLSSTSLPILHESASCLISALTPQQSSTTSNLEFKRKIQNLLTPVLPRLVKLIELHTKTDDIFLRLAIYANRGCQQNKVGIVKTGKAFPILLGQLSDIRGVSDVVPPTNHNVKVWTNTCDLLTTLCQYDDVTAAASTAHDFAQELFRYDAIPILHQLLIFAMNSSNEDNNNLEMQVKNDSFSKLQCSVMSTQRVLAVNDEIVQALVAQGVLKTTCEALNQTLKTESVIASTKATAQSPTIKTATASVAMGLLRNLCGNDDIKTTLCRDSLSSILNSMLQFILSPKIQEHGLGVLAAMSLRRMSNAALLLQTPVFFDTVLRSMQKFSSNEKIQRAGCLCIRNAIARQSMEIKDQIKEDYPLTETVLRNAGRFRGTVDEAYAALRDLDIDVEMVRLEEVEETDENGLSKTNLIVKKRGVEMFGENTLNFRQTWDESDDVEQRIDDLF